MLKIKQIDLSNSSQCFDLLLNDKKQFKYFEQLGWSKNQFILQSGKKNDYSLGLWNSNCLIGFLIGELIYVEKKSEYEILLIYVDKNFRNQGHASYLIDALNISLKSDKLQRISLEVPSSNYTAINLYKKNFFCEIGRRKNYYSNIENIKEDALIFEKKINE